MKREILKKYIDSWDRIDKYERTRFYYFEEKTYVSGSVKNMDLKWKKEVRLPEIKGIKDELEILKKEICDVTSKKEEALKFLREECHCNHEVVISNVDPGICHYNDTCVLCGEKFSNSTLHDSGYSIDAIARKNEKHAIFEGETITNKDGWCEFVEYTTYHTVKGIKDIIRNIAINNTCEDIDLVEEIKKLNLEHCTINNPKNITLILMITGSNKFYLDKHHYVSKEYYYKYNKVVDYFKDMYNTVLYVLGSKEILKTLKDIPNSILLRHFTDLDSLESSLNYWKYIPYNLVINMSNLFKYEFKDNKIVSTNYKLNLDSIFKDTPILDINNIDNLSPDYICEKAKSLIKVKGFNE